MFLPRARQLVESTLLDHLLQAPLRFAVQPIEALDRDRRPRYEWFYRPGLRGVSTQQVFDRLGDEPEAWRLEGRIVERGMAWAGATGRLVSLNVSPAAISRPRFRHLLRDLLGPRPGVHWWEVTESWPPVDPVEGRRTLDLLRDAGQVIAFDDASSRQRLDEWVAALGLPDVVKVDQSVIQRRPGDVPALVDAIRELGAMAVVEGVETHASLLLARGSGAEFWQGYYLATPQYVIEQKS